MFTPEIHPIQIRSQSSQAKLFFEKKLRPATDQIHEKIRDKSVSVMIWIPNLPDDLHPYLNEIRDEMNEQDISIDVSTSIPQISDENAPSEMETLEKGIRDYDITLAIAYDVFPGIVKLFKMNYDRLFRLINEDIAKRLKGKYKGFDFRKQYKQTEMVRLPDDFKTGKFSQQLLHFIQAIRAAKYLESVFINSGLNYISIYHKYQLEITVFLSNAYLFLLAILRYLVNPTKELLFSHLFISWDDLDKGTDYFIKKGFIKSESDQVSPDDEQDSDEQETNGDASGPLSLADTGKRFFGLFELDALPNIEDEKKLFQTQWAFAIDGTLKLDTLAFKDAPSLKKVTDSFYFSRAIKGATSRKIVNWIRKFIFWEWMSEEEKAFWNHPLTDQLFDIWLNNIEGRKQGYHAGTREKIDFLEYIFRNMRIVHDPLKADIYKNFKELAFSLGMLRPNNQAHFYISYAFTAKPNKEHVRQYFKLAVITGQFELLLRRFPPYHNLLNLYASHGDRTSTDLRGLDTVFTYKLDMKFNVAPELSNIQSRRNGFLISCPVEYDASEESVKNAEIANLEEGMEKDSPFPGYFNNIDFGDDGQIYFMGNEEPEVIPMYGMKRVSYIHKRDELKLLKAAPRPGYRSGLIIRFNLPEPVAILLQGINGERHVTLTEIQHAAKTLDLWSSGEPDEVFDKVFKTPDPDGLKDTTRAFLSRLESLWESDPSEESAWQFLTSELSQGQNKLLMQALCRRLMSEGFEVVFSFLPLSTGNQLPLFCNLTEGLEDMLKNLFAKYLDISAATKRARSEPILAGMVVEYCLNIRQDRKAFETKLREHLEKHYSIHYAFLKDYLAHGKDKPAKLEDEEGDQEKNQKPPSAYERIHKLREDMENLINADMAGILELVHGTRQSLYNSNENSRVLAFIDPDSLDVQVGNFEYGGKLIEQEDEFLADSMKRRKKLAELIRHHHFDEQNLEQDKHTEVGTFIRESKTKKKIGMMKFKLLGGKEKFAIAQAEWDAKLVIEKAGWDAKGAEAKLEPVFNEIRLKALESLKYGDIKDYAMLSLIMAHREGGITEVERILQESPTLVMAINPELHHNQEIHEARIKLIDIMKENGKDIDNVAMSILMEKDLKDIVASDVYKEFSEGLLEALKPRVAPPLQQKQIIPGVR
ncbi:MAG: hypothetical protein B6245_03140 [Desulfobacteraceae bacterium 4572_88]|nr:MAG: hypothetical protein B6245_03140 [Desulfobacteraceae bacterium 4572_88]